MLWCPWCRIVSTSYNKWTHLIGFNWKFHGSSGMSELDPTASRFNHVLLVTCVYISFTHFFYSQNLDWNLQKKPRAAPYWPLTALAIPTWYLCSCVGPYLAVYFIFYWDAGNYWGSLRRLFAISRCKLSGGDLKASRTLNLLTWLCGY